MTLAFNACANCLHFVGDCTTSHIEINGRWKEVYLHRCQQRPTKTNAAAVHEECFVSRAEAEHKAKGIDNPVGRTDGLIQGELF